MGLSSKGSGGTCIPPGVSTFLLTAFTAHRIILPGFDLAGADGLIAGNQAFLDGMLRVGHGARDDDGLVVLEMRAGEVQHLRCLDIREGPEHLL